MHWLEENLTFEYPNDSEILRIRLRTHHADEGVKVLDSVVGCYFKEVVEKEVLDRQKEELLLRKLYDEKRDGIVRLTNEVLAMKKEIGNDRDERSPEIARPGPDQAVANDRRRVGRARAAVADTKARKSPRSTPR